MTAPIHPQQRNSPAMDYDRHRVKRRIDAALAGEEYSLTEMAHDLERLATHSVWEESERAAADAEKAYKQGVADAIEWLHTAADRSTDDYAKALLHGNANGLASALTGIQEPPR